MDHADHQWYRQMQRVLQLGGKSPSTQESYLRSVRQLADHCGKDPQEVTEQELSDYILFRRNESRWKPATLRLCYAGLKFYFQRVLNRQWKLSIILHAEDERTLPVVLKGGGSRKDPLAREDISQLHLSLDRLRLRSSVGRSTCTHHRRHRR